MSSLGRGFVAVVPPEDVLDAIEARVAPVRVAHDGLRWSQREQWHITLRFLGPVPDIGVVDASVRDALSVVPPVDVVALGGAGAFPNTRRAAVVWLGVRAGVDALTRVAAAVESACVAAGFPPEPRPFRAHLTVARVPRPRDVAAVLNALGDDPIGGPWCAADIVLVSSDTRPAGAVYSEVARIPLARMGE